MTPLRLPQWVLDIVEIPRDFDKLSEKFVASLKKDLSKFSTENPTVSIVMPVYNEEKNLVHTLYSLSKLKSDFSTELIVVNNNSTDKTQLILDKLEIKSFFLVKQGISYTRQLGLEMAKGKFHLCVDGDSLYHEQWLNEYVNALEDESISVVYGPHSFLPASAEHKRLSLALYEIISGKFFKIRSRNKEYLNVLGFNFGFRTQDGKKAGGFNTARPRWSDGWMAMTLQKKGKIKFIENHHTRVWTSSRRLKDDGNLFKAFIKRIKIQAGNFTGHKNKFKLS